MMKEIKSLFIARRFPPSVGGMERFAFDLSEALSRKEKMTRVTWGGSSRLTLIFAIPWLFVVAFWKLLTDRSYTMLHIQDGVLAPVGWLLHVIFRKPYVVIVHGLDLTYPLWFYQLVIPPFIRRADAVISISKATAREAVKGGVAPEKSFAIPLGIIDDFKDMPHDRRKLEKDLAGIVDIAGKKVLITVGRFVKRKGVAWFIGTVLPDLKKNNPDVIYLVVGDGAERPVIEQAIADNHLEDTVYLLGKVSDEMRGLLLRNADLFVMPNIKVENDMEGFGIVAQEAASAGLTVVASGIEGIADALTDGKNGYLLPASDKEAYIGTITRLLDSPDAREKFGRKAREFTIREYSWDAIADRYVEVFRKLH